MDELLRLNKASNISDLVQKWGGNTTAFKPSTSNGDTPSTSMYLERKVPKSTKSIPTVYSSSRIGLDLSHPSVTDSSTNPRVVYVAKHYRYFIHPHLLTSNGKGQTFLGVYLACQNADGCDNDEDALAQTVKITGLKEQTAVKYFADYNLGLEHGSLRSFIGAPGKGASASPSSYLKLMGTLARKQGNADDSLSDLSES